ncbi:CD226 antigen isoform X2 [Carcharodon carcharias]|uniref:CD226 antigen isoform X2 n=1 Tax=Carcharodon carcharias TaxID=13397 RepID=UPI001B7F3DBF|nr:CD226 antigen isoform X2 [Carcharodon carcharias]
MSWLASYLLLSSGLFLLLRDVTCEQYQNVDSAIKLQDVVVLKCAYPETSKMIQLSWVKNTDGVKHKIAVYNPSWGENIFFPYNQSVTFLSSSVNGDIKLKATAADEGSYQCSINTFPEGMLLKHIAIINPDIFEAKFSRSRAADTHVQLVPGNNVTLPCGFPNGDNVVELTWQRMTEEEINTIVKFTRLQSFISYDYRRRIQSSHLHSQLFNLTVQNVTTNDVGTYFCHVVTNNGSWSKFFDVGVEGITDITMFLIIGAAAFGSLVLVISVVIIICMKRRKKRKGNKKHFKKGTTERNNHSSQTAKKSQPKQLRKS